MRFTKKQLLKIIKEEINNLVEAQEVDLSGPTAAGPAPASGQNDSLSGPTAVGKASPQTTQDALSGPTAVGPADIKKKAVALDRVEELLANLLKQLRQI